MANQITTEKLLEKISEHLNIDKHMKERKALHNTRGVITVEEEVKEDEETPTPGGDDEDPDDPDQPVIPDDIKEYLDTYLKGYVHFAGEIDCTNGAVFPKAALGECYLITGSGMFGTIQVQEGEVMLCIAKESVESSSSEIEKNWAFLVSNHGESSDISPMSNELIDLIMSNKG